MHVVNALFMYCFVNSSKTLWSHILLYFVFFIVFLSVHAVCVYKEIKMIAMYITEYMSAAVIFLHQKWKMSHAALNKLTL